MEPIPFGTLFQRPADRPPTEMEIIMARARRVELERKERRKEERRARRRARVARVLGRR